MADSLWSTVVSVLGAFAGVALGGALQVWTANSAADRARGYRREDEAKLQSEKDTKTAFTKALLARHLEQYAQRCAEAMWLNEDIEEDDPAGLPIWKDWPAVDWSLLSVADMMKVQDFPVRVALMRDRVDGEIRYQASGVGDLKDYYRDGAARIGHETWQMAHRLRCEAGAAPFPFPEGYSFADGLRERVEELEAAEKERNREAAERARNRSTKKRAIKV